MGLTYRSAGVDIGAASRAKKRIQELAQRTHTDRVLTRSGLFGGAVSLPPARQLRRTGLTGCLGFLSSAGEDPAAIVDRCLASLPKGYQPAAFLDYLAASRLEPAAIEALVEGFARRLELAPRIPLIGGETAEMPRVFAPGAWEVVGALFALGEGGAGADLERACSVSRPCLVFSMDGVGTKTGLALAAGRTAGLALDIMHHSLNDILCQGAEGLAFLLYIGCHVRQEAALQPIVQQAQEAAQRLGLALLQVCITEKPQAYLPGQIDVCAAIAGLADAGRLLQGEAVREGDLLVGLASDGLHTNGYSLARRALLEEAGLGLDRHLAELGRTLGEALLEPHRNYAPAVLPLLRVEPCPVRVIAHITGGGLADNLDRVIPSGLRGEIHLSTWEVPPLFRLIQRCGGVPESDPAGRGMLETFNMGIGLVLVVEPGRRAEVLGSLGAAGERAVVIGEIVADSASSSGAKVRLRS
jgi:phosphoribosylformylglycinamidine cyclo-ligase